MPMQGSLSIERMCQLARVSRAGFYRSLQEQVPVEESMEVRSAIQRTALEHRRRYGYRRVTAELRRRGMLVNHKRVARIMREDNLLAVQPKQFVTTTDSNHALEIYLNLARRMTLTGHGSALDRRYHLHSAEGGVCVSGADSGWLFAQGRRLEAGPHAGEPAGDRSPGNGHRDAKAAAGPGAPLRSRHPVRLGGVCCDPEEARDGAEHEPASQSRTTMPVARASSRR